MTLVIKASVGNFLCNPEQQQCVNRAYWTGGIRPHTEPGSESLAYICTQEATIHIIIITAMATAEILNSTPCSALKGINIPKYGRREEIIIIFTNMLITE